MRHYSAGNNHRVGSSGLLRVALAGNRSRGGASGGPKMFPFSDFVARGRFGGVHFSRNLS